MNRRLRLGISTCPNDTFAFHAILNQKIDLRGLDLQIELMDIQELNDRLFRDELDIAKASFHAALHLSDKMWVMPSGSALGFGVGPLLLSSKRDTIPTDSSQVTLCPGEHTTASMLFRLFYPSTSRIEQALFSSIMPRLQEGTADFGVCIHEGRFTWQDEGLFLVEDLGTRWEVETRCPLPLGGILGSRAISPDVLGIFQAVLHESIEYASSHREETLPTMRKYAQEFQDEVLMQHVDLYVNDWTKDLGEVGQRALDELSTRARSIGLITPSAKRLCIFRNTSQ